MVHKNEYLTSGMVCVRLTEYEQELNLPLNLLRDLTSFSIDELIQPAQLILYYIDGVYSPTGWSPDLLQALQSFLTTNQISLRPTFQCRNFNFARVFVNDVNLAEHIKNKGLGCVIESNKLMVVAEEYFRKRETVREPNAGVLSWNFSSIIIIKFSLQEYYIS
jgi:hypothetical protein